MTMQALSEAAVMIAGEIKRRAVAKWDVAARLGWIREEKLKAERGEVRRLRPWGRTEPSLETQQAIARIEARKVAAQ